MARLLTALVAAPLLWVEHPIHAADPQRWTLEQLMRERGQVLHARARFTEERISSLFDKPIILTGTLRYDSPARVEKQIDTPFKESYIVIGDNLRIERRGKRTRTLTLSDHPVLWAFVESIRATLAGDLAGLRHFYDVHLYGDRQRWRLVLVPLDAKMKGLVSSIAIEGSKADITGMKIEEVGGDSSRLSIWPQTS